MPFLWMRSLPSLGPSRYRRHGMPGASPNSATATDTWPNHEGGWTWRGRGSRCRDASSAAPR
jgi:hypothetical protein